MKSLIHVLAIASLSVVLLNCTADGGNRYGSDTTSGKVSQSAVQEVTVDEAAKRALRAGDRMPEFQLQDARNRLVRSSELLNKSNLVLVFYRGGWCPFCNTYLKQLQDELSEIESAGGTLVAISAEKPDDSLTTQEKNKLEFYVLSDRNLETARRFGLVYQLAAETNKKYKEKGIDLAVDNDMEKPELPISATYVVNRKGEIVYSFIEPDYKKRATPKIIINELNKLKSSSG